MTRITIRQSGWYWLTWAVIALVVVIWLARSYVGSIALDDAYITYRYAVNLAELGQLVYNLEAPENAFATTAPAYAILLAGLHRLGADIPWIAAILGALGILATAWALGDAVFRATRDSEFTWPGPTGLVAGGLLAFAPLLWLVLGMEGLAASALILLGYWFANRRQEPAAAILLGFAVAFRFDAVAAAAAWGLLLFVRRRWQAWKPLVLCGGVVLVIYGAMHFLIGVPLPSTLASKQAQVALGITGFFPNVSYVDGAVWIVKAYWKQSPLAFGLVVFLAFIGFICILVTFSRGVSTIRTRSEQATTRGLPTLGIHLYVSMLLLWAALHLALYIVLKVTPYLWYYLPFIPVLAALGSIGLSTLTSALPEWPRQPWLKPFVFGLLLVVAGSGMVRSHHKIQDQLQSYVHLSPADPETTVLPGSQVPSYRQAGEWLAANTPEHATVGVSDLGIIGYHSRRSMTDFWGLLDHEVADALARRDIVWALYTHQPDYLALFGEAPLFGYDVFKDRWFQTTYEPIYHVPAGKVTIYRRRLPRSIPDPAAKAPPDAVPMAIRFGDLVELTAYSAPSAPWSADTPLDITYYWRVLKKPDKDYTVFTHLIDGRGAIVASRDAPPLLGARPMSQWQPGEEIADYQPLGFDPLPLAPTEVSFEIGLYDQTGQRLPAYGPDGFELPGGQAGFGRYPLLPGSTPAILAARPPANIQLAIRDYDLGSDRLQKGKTTSLGVDVAGCDCPLQLAAELWDENGQRLVWQQEVTVETPGRVEYDVAVAEGELADWPQLRLRARQGDIPLPFTDAAGQSIQDTLPLTTVQLVEP